MTVSKLCTAVCILATLAFAPSANAVDGDWTPFEARKRTTIYEVGKDGKETVVERREGVVLRTSSGRELRVEGRVSEGREFRLEAGELVDRTTGDTYQLLYARKRAHLLFRGKGPVSPPEKTAEYMRRAEQLSLGENTIGGVACQDRPILMADILKPGAWERIGTVCRSAEHDIALKRVKDQSGARGLVRRTVEELYDVRIGVEPEVAIPADFEVVDVIMPMVNAFCGSCGR